MAEPPTHLSLPNLLVYFPNPSLHEQGAASIHYRRLNNLFHEWLDPADLSPRMKKTLEAIQMPMLICYAYPHASIAQLQISLDYLILAFLFEEVTDNTTATESKKWADAYMHMYTSWDQTKDPGKSTTRTTTNQVLPIMQRLARGVMCGLPAEFHGDFIAGNQSSVEAIVQEAVLRESESSSQPMTLKLYYKQRASTVGLIPFLILARCFLGHRLPKKIIEGAHLNQMMQKAVEMVFLANDLYSFRKESQANSLENNVLTVIMKDPTTRVGVGNTQESVNYSRELFRTSLSEFNQNCVLMLSSPGLGLNAEEEKVVQRYCGALIDCVVGNIKWSLRCERYGLSYTKNRPEEDIVVMV